MIEEESESGGSSVVLLLHVGKLLFELEEWYFVGIIALFICNMKEKRGCCCLAKICLALTTVPAQIKEEKQGVSVS